MLLTFLVILLPYYSDLPPQPVRTVTNTLFQGKISFMNFPALLLSVFPGTIPAGHPSSAEPDQTEQINLNSLATNPESTIKYYRVNDHKRKLVPANSKYKDIEIVDGMGFGIWGVVTHVISDPKNLKDVC